MYVLNIGLQFLGVWGFGYVCGFLIYSYRKISENVV